MARAPLFASLSKRHVRAIAKVTGVSEYAAGATLVKEGEPGVVFFVILEGWANVLRGTRVAARLAPGDFFGEISLLDGGPRTASVVARAKLVCLELAKRDFDPILDNEPKVAARICRELARRLRERERPLVW
jgi:CRP-like cAMP-binding protein